MQIDEDASHPRELICTASHAAAGRSSAGGTTMQAATGTPIDIVLVLQSTIVLFIAAPPLVRAIYRLPAPGSGRHNRRSSTTPPAVPVPTTTGQEA